MLATTTGVSPDTLKAGSMSYSIDPWTGPVASIFTIARSTRYWHINDFRPAASAHGAGLIIKWRANSRLLDSQQIFLVQLNSAQLFIISRTNERQRKPARSLCLRKLCNLLGGNLYGHRAPNLDCNCIGPFHFIQSQHLGIG